MLQSNAVLDIPYTVCAAYCYHISLQAMKVNALNNSYFMCYKRARRQRNTTHTPTNKHQQTSEDINVRVMHTLSPCHVYPFIHSHTYIHSCTFIHAHSYHAKKQNSANKLTHQHPFYHLIHSLISPTRSLIHSAISMPCIHTSIRSLIRINKTQLTS